jgi:hypothetical protein
MEELGDQGQFIAFEVERLELLGAESPSGISMMFIKLLRSGSFGVGSLAR